MRIENITAHEADFDRRGIDSNGKKFNLTKKSIQVPDENLRMNYILAEPASGIKTYYYKLIFMEKKMNVLFIITDQFRADHLGCYGNAIVKTPNLDKLASEGVRFTNAFCTNPMCMPNRSTILTGLYPNVHGVRSNGINLPTDIPTITEALYKRGYHTINVGKPQ